MGKRLTVYSVWMEGWAATGGDGPAEFVGRAVAGSFLEACLEVMGRPPWNDGLYDPGRNAYWGRRLFDNEGGARRAFGWGLWENRQLGCRVLGIGLRPVAGR